MIFKSMLYTTLLFESRKSNKTNTKKKNTSFDNYSLQYCISYTITFTFDSVSEESPSQNIFKYFISLNTGTQYRFATILARIIRSRFNFDKIVQVQISKYSKSLRTRRTIAMTVTVEKTDVLEIWLSVDAPDNSIRQ